MNEDMIDGFITGTIAGKEYRLDPQEIISLVLEKAEDAKDIITWRGTAWSVKNRRQTIEIDDSNWSDFFQSDPAKCLALPESEDLMNCVESLLHEGYQNTNNFKVKLGSDRQSIYIDIDTIDPIAHSKFMRLVRDVFVEKGLDISVSAGETLFLHLQQKDHQVTDFFTNWLTSRMSSNLIQDSSAKVSEKDTSEHIDELMQKNALNGSGSPN